MIERVRTPAFAPPAIIAASPRFEDPTAFLATHYAMVWETRMRDLPFVNAALAVEVAGFRRCSGDWVGVITTPWFLNLFLLYGGGNLWGDIPAGERRYVNLPCGTLQFIADVDPDLGPYQYCPLIAPVSTLPDMATARAVASDALTTVFAPPPVVTAPAGDAPGVTGMVGAEAGEERRPVSRRGFLRTLAGRR